MKSTAQSKFDTIIKEGFQKILKPLGFRKKALNFYLQLSDLGHVINIQKNKYSNKEELSYTINCGVFIPEYWKVVYNYRDEPVPDFPTERVCFIRERIGPLMGKDDTWYKVDSSTDEKKVSGEMQIILEQFILPFFNKLRTKADILSALEDPGFAVYNPGRIVLYGEYGEFEKAKAEYEKVINEIRQHHPYKMTVLEYGKKYGIV